LVGTLARHAEQVADLGDADEVARLLVHLTDARPRTSLASVKRRCPGRELAPPPGVTARRNP
jgi:hypothetical protein